MLLVARSCSGTPLPRATNDGRGEAGPGLSALRDHALFSFFKDTGALVSKVAQFDMTTSCCVTARPRWWAGPTRNGSRRTQPRQTHRPHGFAVLVESP